MENLRYNCTLKRAVWILTVPPDINDDDQTSTDMVVKEGSNVTLKCSATGLYASAI